MPSQLGFNPIVSYDTRGVGWITPFLHPIILEWYWSQLTVLLGGWNEFMHEQSWPPYLAYGAQCGSVSVLGWLLHYHVVALSCPHLLEGQHRHREVLAQGWCGPLMPTCFIPQDHRWAWPDAPASREKPSFGSRVPLPLLQLLPERRALAPTEQWADASFFPCL